MLLRTPFGKAVVLVTSALRDRCSRYWTKRMANCWKRRGVVGARTSMAGGLGGPRCLLTARYGDSCVTAARQSEWKCVRHAIGCAGLGPSTSTACCVEGPLQRHRRKRLAGFVRTNRRHPRWPGCPASVRSRDGARARNPRPRTLVWSEARKRARRPAAAALSNGPQAVLPPPSAADQLGSVPN